MMDKNKLIEDFIKNHNSWLYAVCFNLTKDRNDADDLLQETYARLLALPDTKIESIRFGENDLNTYFVYLMAKNYFINQRKGQKETYTDIISEDTDKDTDYAFEAANKLLVDKINEELEGMEKDSSKWFDAKLLKVYLEEGHSIDSLAKQTNISRSTIFTSLKRVRTYLSASYCEEYQKTKIYE
jgi:RNA polymerase sigma factor (sigma-70 family)